MTKSIAAKFLVPVVLLAVGFTAVEIYTDYSAHRGEMAELTDRQAALALAFDLAIRSYVAEEIRPAMEERVAPGEFMPETMSTSFVARSIFEKVRQDFPDYMIKFSSDNPRNPANQAGPDELRMIQYFNEHPEAKKWAGEIELNGRPHLAHFSARRMKEKCLRCHGRPEDAPASLVERYGATAGFHRPVGEVVALDTVAIPMDKTQATVVAVMLRHAAFIAVGFAVLVLLIALTFRFVVARRLARMRTHFEGIAAQPDAATMQPAEERGNDEISALVRSFNTMVERVRDAHASLEQRVEDQTADLRQANEGLQREVNDRKQTEELLKQNEEKYRSLVVNIPDVCWTTDSTGNTTFISPNVERVYGFTQGEIYEAADRLWWRRIHPDDADRVQAAFEMLFDTGEPFNEEYRIQRKDGTWIWLRDWAITSYERNGVKYADGVFSDITERKQAEEDLRESEERHRAITETAQDAIITADAEGNIWFWNTAAEMIFGFTGAEVVGKNMMELIVPPQYHEAKRKGLAEFAHSGRGAAVGRTLELTALRKDGTEFPIEISLSGYKKADSFMAVALVRDITKRKRWERELRTAHAETRQLLEAIPSMLVNVDDNDRVTTWNAMAEELSGIDAKDAVGRLFQDLEIDWDHKTIAKGISGLHTTKKPVRLDDVRFKQLDGKEGFLGVTLTPMRVNGGEHGGFFLLASDVTERRILEGQLTQAQKLESIGQLAAGIAHEINTPIQYVGDNVRFLSDSMDDLLGLIGSYRDLISEIAKGASAEDCVGKVTTLEQEADLPYLEEELPKSIEQGLDGVARVSKIVLAMKGFAHPGTEEKGLADLNQAIETTITISRNEWKYVAEMVTDFDPTLPRVPCLVGEFNQVILNLIVNAAHAITGVVGDGAAGKGTITISTRRDGNWAEVRVRDTGTGIPAEHQPRVFDHFFTTKEVGKGTGQGLAIAYSVVTEQHGGTITFETEIGKGTTFIIRLPTEHESAAPKETLHHEEAYSLR